MGDDCACACHVEDCLDAGFGRQVCGPCCGEPLPDVIPVTVKRKMVIDFGVELKARDAEITRLQAALDAATREREEARSALEREKHWHREHTIRWGKQVVDLTLERDDARRNIERLQDQAEAAEQALERVRCRCGHDWRDHSRGVGVGDYCRHCPCLGWDAAALTPPASEELP